jgi:very-short-patch-repair endonuclease
MRIQVAYGALVDTPLAALAANQHGVVAASQLATLGFSASAIRRMGERGWLFRIHRGVYAVGHPRLTLHGRWMAAVLACGAEAVLSHHQAAALHDLRRAPWSPIHITAPGLRGHAGVECHAARGMRGRSRMIVDGIPVTSVERAFLDMATLLGPQPLRSLLEAAQRKGSFHYDRVLAVIERSNGHRGIGSLRMALALLGDQAPATRSDLEILFLELIRAAGLPEPSVNVIVSGNVVDFCWPEYNLVVEVDSLEYHRLRRPFEEDKRRGNRLELAHVTLLRYTDERLREEPEQVVAELRAAMAR